MFFGTYFLVILVVLLISLFAIFLRVNPHGRWRNRRARLLSFVGTTLLVALVGIVLFTALSAWVGLMQFGIAQDFNFPADYMQAGASGWGLLALLVLLVLSPLALAVRFSRPDRNEKFSQKKPAQRK